MIFYLNIIFVIILSNFNNFFNVLADENRVCKFVESNTCGLQVNDKTENAGKLYPLSIIFFGDFHSRYEETNIVSTKCKPKDGEKCIGGYARIVSKVKSLLEEKKDKNPLYLNSGDNYQGTLWFTLLKWNVTSHFMNLFPAHAMVLGNHEFDNEIDGLTPFLDSIKTPIIVANIDDTEEERLHGKYQKFIIIEKSGKKIGIIGVINGKTNELSMTEKLKFFDEIETAKNQSKNLKENYGVDIVVILSHCGIKNDREIAKRGGSDISIIVGGHSHTFLYTGDNPPGHDIPADQFPIVVEQDDGHKVLIVHASCFSKYLGDITVYFDDQNKVAAWDGNPIYLDEQVPKDPEIEAELMLWKKEVDHLANRIVGFSKVFLSKTDCRTGECNFGSFVADAFVDFYVDKFQNSYQWSSIPISILNDGGLRTSLNPGMLTFDDLVMAIPYENTIDTFDLLGEHLLEAIEYGATSFNTANMIQVSGLKIVYNITNPIGKRTIEAKVRCQDCETPSYNDLDRTKVYKLAVPHWIAAGGNGFTMFGDHRMNVKKGPLDIDLFVSYVEKMTPITQGNDGRIKIVI